jgi:hypothetical protein
VPSIRDVAVRTLGGLGVVLIPAIQVVFGVFLVLGFGLGFWRAWTDSTAPMPAGYAARWQSDPKLVLCRTATACKKYDEMRLECATAGNLKTCLRIKMGEDASYIGTCSGYVEGGPAVPLAPETPNALGCFYHRIFFSFGH